MTQKGVWCYGVTCSTTACRGAWWEWGMSPSSRVRLDLAVTVRDRAWGRGSPCPASTAFRGAAHPRRGGLCAGDQLDGSVWNASPGLGPDRARRFASPAGARGGGAPPGARAPRGRGPRPGARGGRARRPPLLNPCAARPTRVRFGAEGPVVGRRNECCLADFHCGRSDGTRGDRRCGRGRARGAIRDPLDAWSSEAWREAA